MKTLFTLLLALALPAAALANHHEAGDPSAPAAGDYPLKTCVVSGENLGEMGDPYVITYHQEGHPDREVRLCCEMCKGRFNSNPAKYLAKLDAAAATDQSAPAPAEATPEHAGHAAHDHSKS